MPTLKDTVTIVLSGEVALADFAKAIFQFDNLIKELSINAGSKDVEWLIHDLEFSSTIATARGIGAQELVEPVVHAFESVGDALEKNNIVPFPKKIQVAARELKGIVKGKIESITFETAERESIIRPYIMPAINEEHREQLVLHPPSTAIGSIHGRVQTLSNRGSLRFTIYDLLHDKAVSCYLKEGCEEMMRDAWGNLATVTGMVTRDPVSGRPISIRQISKVDTDVKEVGDYRKARGASPSLSGMTPEEAIRRIRDAK